MISKFEHKRRKRDLSDRVIALHSSLDGRKEELHKINMRGSSIAWAICKASSAARTSAVSRAAASEPKESVLFEK